MGTALKYFRYQMSSIVFSEMNVEFIFTCRAISRKMSQENVKKRQIHQGSIVEMPLQQVNRSVKNHQFQVSKIHGTIIAC